MFPSTVLERIYVKGSLKNTEKGCEFSLKNVVDSGTIAGFGPIKIDGKAYLAAALTVITKDTERRGDAVTYQAPMQAYLGSMFTIRLDGEQLAAGEHAISITLLTREIGRIDFTVKDSVA